MGKFKMKGVDFGNGEGRQVEVKINQGPKPNIDPNDPSYSSVMYPGTSEGSFGDTGETLFGDAYTSPGEGFITDYEQDIIEGKGVDDEGVYTGAGINPRRAADVYVDYNPRHEQFTGVKDAFSGYSDLALGARTEQEISDQERFGDTGWYVERDLNIFKEGPASKHFSLSDAETLLKEGTGTGSKAFKDWLVSNEIPEYDYQNPDHYRKFSEQVDQVLNLDNELKVAADKGYHPDPEVLETLSGDISEYLPSEHSKRQKEINLKNVDLRKDSRATRIQDNLLKELLSKAESGEYDMGRVLDSLMPSEIQALMGFRNNKQYSTPTIEENKQKFIELATQHQDKYGIYNWDTDLLGADPGDKKAWKKHLKEQKEIQEDVNLQEQKNLEETREAELVDKETENIDSGEPVVKQFTSDKEPKQLEGDYNNDGVVDYMDKRFAPDTEKTDKPQDHIKTENDIKEVIKNADDSVLNGNEESDSKTKLPGDYNEDGVVDYMDKRFAPMTKSMFEIDYSKPNPFSKGTAPYYKFKKDQRAHRAGLTKNIYNVWGDK